MSAITESLNLDVTRRSNIKVIHIKQGDTNSRRITTPILVDGTKQTIVGSSNTALINIRRPDAQQKSFAATINSDNTVTAVIPNFAAEIASTPTRMTVASISIMEGTTVKYETEDFLIDVGKTNEGARGADSDADILMELIAYTNEAVDRVNSIIDTTTEHMERAEAAAETAERIVDDATGFALASFATDTASGTIANFPDGADDIPVKSAVFAIDPIQDLNGYDSPWPAGGGKNLWSPTFATAMNASSTVTASGGEVRIETTGASNYSGMGTVRGQDLPAGTYYIKLKLKSGATLGANAAFGIRSRSTNSFFGTKVMTASTLEYSFVTTTTEDGYFSVLGTWTDGTAADFTIYDVMISTTDTAYEPYENICPITGWTQAKVSVQNKNWLPMPVTPSPYTAAGVTQVENEDGSVTFSGTATANSWRYWNTYNAQGLYNFRFPAGNYRLSSGITEATSGGYRLQMTVYDRATNAIKRAYEDYGSGKDIVIQEDETEAVYLYVPSGKVMDGITLYPMLTRQDDEQTFAKQILNEQIITWSEAGTVYGGTLQYLGGERWRLTRTMGQTTIGALTANDTEYANTFRFYISDKANGVNNFICSAFAYKRTADVANLPNGAMCGVANSPNTYFKDTNYATAADFKAAHADEQIAYALATPETYDLTADELTTLLGMNNVWSDTGSAEVTYRADTALYINKLLNP